VSHKASPNEPEPAHLHQRFLFHSQSGNGCHRDRNDAQPERNL